MFTTEGHFFRSLDSHCSYHGAGYTTEQLGAIEERHKYSNQYMKCMIECFGADVVCLLSHRSSIIEQKDFVLARNNDNARYGVW